MSTTFKDIEGREWSPRMTLSVADRVKDECGLDLIEFRHAPGTGTVDLLKQMEDVHVQMCCLWHSVRADAEKLGISRQEFADSFDCDRIQDGMAAFYRVLVNFTPRNVRAIWTEVLDYAALKMAEADEKMPQVLKEVDKALASID